MPLKGIKVVEMAGVAPGPFCGMLLKEFGANVILVQKFEESTINELSNGKLSISINLKSQQGVEIFKNLCKTTDVLIDTYRPGVMEKLGLGPEVLLKINEGIIFSRLTGYGQTGILSGKAAHDINCIALSGILPHLQMKNEKPFPPPNLQADFGGGGMMCAFGILLALFERSKSGKGQIVDAAMVEGTRYLASLLFRFQLIRAEIPGENIFDGGSSFYNVYKTKDDKYMSVGALEPQFYEQLLKGLGLSGDQYSQYDSVKGKNKFEEIFLTKTRKEWCEIFDKLDACVTPVLNFNEICNHEHELSRKSLTKDEFNNPVPKPAPVLSKTPGISYATSPKPTHGQHTVSILKDIGYREKEIQQFIEDGHVYAKLRSSL